MNKPLNIVRRASFKGGWISLLQGSSKLRTLDRGIQQLNSDGYEVVLVEDDDWGFLGKLLSIIILFATLGFFTLSEGFLIIGQAAAPSSPRVAPSSSRVELRD